MNYTSINLCFINLGFEFSLKGKGMTEYMGYAYTPYNASIPIVVFRKPCQENFKKIRSFAYPLLIQAWRFGATTSTRIMLSTHKRNFLQGQALLG